MGSKMPKREPKINLLIRPVAACTGWAKLWTWLLSPRSELHHGTLTRRLLTPPSPSDTKAAHFTSGFSFS